MAKQATGNGGDGATAGHNIAHIHKSINDTFAKIYQVEQDIAAAQQRHVDHLKEDRTQLWREVKKTTNITRKVLSAHYKLYAMAKDAAFDEEDGNETLDGMRIAFEALQRNGQLDWITTIEVATPRGKAPSFVGKGAKGGKRATA